MSTPPPLLLFLFLKIFFTRHSWVKLLYEDLWRQNISPLRGATAPSEKTQTPSLTILSRNLLPFSPAICLSVSVLPGRCVMIHNHHSASPSTSITLYGLSQSGARSKGTERRQTERKRQPSSQGRREGYSALHFGMTSRTERCVPVRALSVVSSLL